MSAAEAVTIRAAAESVAAIREAAACKGPWGSNLTSPALCPKCIAAITEACDSLDAALARWEAREQATPTGDEVIVQWEVWWRRRSNERWRQSYIEHSEHNGRGELVSFRKRHPDYEAELRKVTFVSERVCV